MITEVDIQDAALWAQVKFQRWKEEFEKEFNEPTLEIIRAQFWLSLPESVREQYKTIAPDVYKRMNEKYGG